jgi:hypothetical protein
MADLHPFLRELTTFKLKTFFRVKTTLSLINIRDTVSVIIDAPAWSTD